MRLWGMGVASCYYVEYNVGEYSVLELKMSTKSLQENKMGVMQEGKLRLNMALPLIASILVQAL